MNGRVKKDLFTLVEKHPFRCKKLVKVGTIVTLRTKGGGYDVTIAVGELMGYIFQLTEREYYCYIERTD